MENSLKPYRNSVNPHWKLKLSCILFCITYERWNCEFMMNSLSLIIFNVLLMYIFNVIFFDLILQGSLMLKSKILKFKCLQFHDIDTVWKQITIQFLHLPQRRKTIQHLNQSILHCFMHVNKSSRLAIHLLIGIYSSVWATSAPMIPTQSEGNLKQFYFLFVWEPGSGGAHL